MKTPVMLFLEKLEKRMNKVKVSMIEEDAVSVLSEYQDELLVKIMTCLLRCKIKIGKTPFYALKEVLLAHVGEEDEAK